MIIQLLETNPSRYVQIVLTVIISIVLHELAHGWAAIRQGDDTPIRLGRMTGNPMVHMGGLAIVMLLLIGISYGQMPVNRARFKSKYGDAIVSGAGPLMNFVLAFVSLTVLAVMVGLEVGVESGRYASNLMDFMTIFGVTNIVLGLFNLLPVPPLDGASILANFSPGYRRIIENPQYSLLMFAFFIFVFINSNFFAIANDVAATYLAAVVSLF